MENKFFNNWIVKNLLKALLLVVFLVVVTSILLGVFTQHSKIITVPDLKDLPAQEAIALASQNSLRAEITDSVYVRRMEKGAVFSQNPKAGSAVKKGRKVRLTINAIVPKKISMPNLIGYSMRQARAELMSKGLNLGTLIYVKDMATNNVLKQLYRNVEIAPGTLIESGATINLVVGLDDYDNTTYVPNVVGMKNQRAVEIIHDNSLNIRRLVFDKNVKDYSDSLNAVVYKQSPSPSNEALGMGSEVTLYLSLEEDSQ